MNLGKLIEKLQTYPEDYTVSVCGDDLVLDSNGVDWLNGETDIYLNIETLKTEQPAKDFKDKDEQVDRILGQLGRLSESIDSDSPYDYRKLHIELVKKQVSRKSDKKRLLDEL